MTKRILERLGRMEASGFDGMIREGAEAFAGYYGPRPCGVHHRDAGGWCERDAVMEIYGLGFCEVHGAEARAGALAELYHDAGNALEDLYRSEDSSANVAALAFVAASRDELSHRCIEAEEAEELAVRQAYPVIPERVCSETRAYDPFVPGSGASPADVYRGARTHAHKLMRLSWSVGEYWILEDLEEHRESASAQLAWALDDIERKIGKPA
jgi:hypothetical protein